MTLCFSPGQAVKIVVLELQGHGLEAQPCLNLKELKRYIIQNGDTHSGGSLGVLTFTNQQRLQFF